MTALSADRVTLKMGGGAHPSALSLAVKTATTIYEGSIVCIDSTTGYAVPASTATTLYVQGVATEQVVNAGASGAKTVNVEPGVFLMGNSSSSDEITQAEVGTWCYLVDDQTVAKTNGSSTRSRAGVVYGIASGGVWVQFIPQSVPLTTVTLTGSETLTNKTLTTPTISATGFANANHAHTGSTSGGKLTGAAMSAASAGAISFTAGDVQVNAVTGSHYLVPTTATNSTISLQNPGSPAMARGDWVIFTADGSVNGHTVTYRDGTTAISAAATASKRHTAICCYDGTNWHCNLYIGP